jgi:hypothetical protein
MSSKRRFKWFRANWIGLTVIAGRCSPRRGDVRRVGSGRSAGYLAFRYRRWRLGGRTTCDIRRSGRAGDRKRLDADSSRRGRSVRCALVISQSQGSLARLRTRVYAARAAGASCGVAPPSSVAPGPARPDGHGTSEGSVHRRSLVPLRAQWLRRSRKPGLSQMLSPL